jgi:hypothetical protein
VHSSSSRYNLEPEVMIMCCLARAITLLEALMYDDGIMMEDG